MVPTMQVRLEDKRGRTDDPADGSVRGPRRRAERLGQLRHRTRSCSRSAELTRILGLDPGTRVTGWGLVAGDPRRVTVVEFGRLMPRRALSRAAALASLSDQLEELLGRLAPDVAAVETPFFGRFPKAALASPRPVARCSPCSVGGAARWWNWSRQGSRLPSSGTVGPKSNRSPS